MHTVEFFQTLKQTHKSWKTQKKKTYTVTSPNAFLEFMKIKYLFMI